MTCQPGRPQLSHGLTRTRSAAGSRDTTALIWDVRGLRQIPQPRPVAGKGLEHAWAALAENDAARAYQAIADLIAVPEEAVPFLQQHMKPPSAPDPQRLAQLVAELDSEEFAVRQKATDELQRLGDAAEMALRQTLAGNPSLELRQRVEPLLKQASLGVTPARLRVQRAIQALEWMGTPKAKQLLQMLAQGSDWPQRSREDAQALARLSQGTVEP